jgi:signal transduction histidine kinase/CheY-like chemotaxis protein
MLHALLLALFALTAVAAVVLYPFSPNKFVIAVTIPLLQAALAAALIQLRCGLLRPASLTYLVAVWSYITVIAVLDSGIHSVALLYYVALPVSAAWLLGYRAAFWTAGSCLGAMLLFAFADAQGVLVRHSFSPTAFGSWFHGLVAIMVCTVPVANILRSLREALSKSRQVQDELQKYEQHLEDLVAQRTTELVKALDQAQAANEAKSVFLTNMSHELRTPLNAILGFSNLLRESSVSEDQRRDLDIICRSGEHLLGLIDAVLDVAKIEAGRRVLEIAPCDLESIVRGVTEMMRARAEEKKLALALVAAPGFPRYVRADAARLRQVLINLLGNAVQYTAEGSVTLRVNSRTAADAEHLVLVFDVEDTGIGIAKEDQARIFEPFVQVGKSEGPKGTGLGLSITRQFIELMGGTIQVESSPGQGSRFRVEAPVAVAQELEVKAHAAQRERNFSLEAGQPEYRVLIVEDERENWMVLARLLEDAGFQVRVAEDGERGIEIFREWRPHFIWMDLRLPGMYGVEAACRIRALDGGREVKIAAVTASGFGSERSELLIAGLDDLVRKPYRPSEIFDCMARHLGLRYRRGDAPPAGRAVELRPEDLATLPEHLRTELRAAVIDLNAERIAGVIERITERDAALGSMFASCASRLAYTAILGALEPNQSRVDLRERAAAGEGTG